MIYITGDTHGDFTSIMWFLYNTKTTKDDVLIILGDVGINYNLNLYDDLVKTELDKEQISFLCINGNHEERPENIETYHLKHIKHKAFEADCYVEDEYPNLYFLKNGAFKLVEDSQNKGTDLRCLSISGAYSVDKDYRLKHGYQWFESEELTDKEMTEIIDKIYGEYDYVFTHTCPEKYIPMEALMDGIDQDSVSRRMETFLDKVENTISYKKWYCGHWHIEKQVDKLRFLFHSVEQLQL